MKTINPEILASLLEKAGDRLVAQAVREAMVETPINILPTDSGTGPYKLFFKGQHVKWNTPNSVDITNCIGTVVCDSDYSRTVVDWGEKPNGSRIIVSELSANLELVVGLPAEPAVWLPEPSSNQFYWYEDGSRISPSVVWNGKWLAETPHDVVRDDTGKSSIFGSPLDAAHAIVKLGYGPAKGKPTAALAGDGEAKKSIGEKWAEMAIYAHHDHSCRMNYIRGTSPSVIISTFESPGRAEPHVFSWQRILADWFAAADEAGYKRGLKEAITKLHAFGWVAAAEMLSEGK